MRTTSTDDSRMFYLYTHSIPGARWQKTATATIVLADLTEGEAFEKEVEMIARFKGAGQCEANTSTGGRGVGIQDRWWGSTIRQVLTGSSLTENRVRPVAHAHRDEFMVPNLQCA